MKEYKEPTNANCVFHFLKEDIEFPMSASWPTEVSKYFNNDSPGDLITMETLADRQVSKVFVWKLLVLPSLAIIS